MKDPCFMTVGKYLEFGFVVACARTFSMMCKNMPNKSVGKVFDVKLGIVQHHIALYSFNDTHKMNTLHYKVVYNRKLDKLEINKNNTIPKLFPTSVATLFDKGLL